MIKWNGESWYSRMFSIILFLGIIPAVSFYIGMMYERTINVITLSVSIGPVMQLLDERLIEKNQKLHAAQQSLPSTLPLQ